MSRKLLFFGLACAASPALADHMGPSAFGAGGGVSAFGADTLDGGHWSAGLRLAYTRPEQRPDSELEALAGQDIGAHNTAYNFNASLGVAYGMSHHLTVSAELPYIHRDRLREGSADAVEQLGSVSGIGDVSLLAKYRLTKGEGFGFALIGGIKMPTGGTHRRSRSGERLETEHQPGSGSWDPIVGAAASLPLGGVQLAASGLYQVATQGAQRTRLGDRFQGGIALSTTSDRGARCMGNPAIIIMETSSMSTRRRGCILVSKVLSSLAASGRGGNASAAKSRRRAAANGSMPHRGCGTRQRPAGRLPPALPCRCGSKSAPRTRTTATG